MALTLRNLFKCKQVACSVVVTCFVYPLSFLYCTLLSLVYFFIYYIFVFGAFVYHFKKTIFIFVTKFNIFYQTTTKLVYIHVYPVWYEAKCIHCLLKQSISFPFQFSLLSFFFSFFFFLHEIYKRIFHLIVVNCYKLLLFYLKPEILQMTKHYHHHEHHYYHNHNRMAWKAKMTVMLETKQ